MRETRLLVVEDDASVRDSLVEFLTVKGFVVGAAPTLKEAHRQLERRRVDLVLLDVHLPDGSGLDLLDCLRQRPPHVPVIIITGYASIDGAVQAIKRGADDYLTKPLIDSELLRSIREALGKNDRCRDAAFDSGQSDPRDPFARVLTRDGRMKDLLRMIRSVSRTDTTLLMTGPSGSGKSLLARAIHQCSHRAAGPFVEVSCGALPETLLESELFGHVKGAFTGATRDRTGKFLQADGGTIFLDEIGTASPAMQLKLLRVLEERCFEAVGGTETRSIDTRVLLATNADLEAEVAAGRFREDLYYRINVVRIDLPALRERPDDIALLAQAFLERFCRRHGRAKSGFSPRALDALRRYPWPGNVRELENVVERAVLLSAADEIGLVDLPAAVQCTPAGETRRPVNALKQARVEPERRLILKALEENHWNRQRAAKALGINRTTLYKKIKRYGLELPL